MDFVHQKDLDHQIRLQPNQKENIMAKISLHHRSINHEAPKYLTGLFQRLSETCARQLRNTSTDLYAPLLKPHVAKNASRIEELKFGMI